MLVLAIQFSRTINARGHRLQRGGGVLGSDGLPSKLGSAVRDVDESITLSKQKTGSGHSSEGADNPWFEPIQRPCR